MGSALSKRKLLRLLLLGLFLAGVWATPVRAQAKGPWARMVIIGASVSHGFTFAEPSGGPQTKELALDRYLDAAVVAPHEPAQNLASEMFFMVPDDMGHTQIRQALTNNPTLVIGIDFLFWFCYGHGETDQERLDHFEKGLKLLEAVECPLIIGDIPNASPALNRALSPGQFANAEVRAAANRRLKEWAAQHRQVVVVPAARFMRTVLANKALTLHGLSIAQGRTRALLQGDCLHPSRRGSAVLVLSILDSFLAARPGLDAADVRWDPEEVLKAAGHF
jgi:hypothetical protein